MGIAGGSSDLSTACGKADRADRQRTACGGELAAQAGVNPNTMQRALAEMEREGLIFTNRTSGRYVTEDREMIGKVREQIAGERITEFLSGMSQLGFTEQDIVALLEKRSGEEKKNG